VKVVFLGATKGMGRALARLMAERGDRVFLLGRHAEDLGRSARDLQLRAGGALPVQVAPCDLEKPETFDAALEAADQALGGFDTVVVTAALFNLQDAYENDEAALHSMLVSNFANTVLFCEKARKRLLSRGGGTLCVFSSVAGDRGRKPVVLYGASKAGLSAYLEGLDHRFRAQGLRTICVKPGFVRTGMTAGRPSPPFAGEPEDVARTVLRGLDAGTPVIYAPGIWAWMMRIIRSLPRFVMRRAEF
jgi:decaprenylphospho-beta-D-erythro-pentofuranosid-2-ulose 2-reductase